MALISNTPRIIELGNYNDLPVQAGVMIFQGAAVGIDGDGLARELQISDTFAGFADSQADNRRGGSGNIKVRIRKQGHVILPVDGVTGQADVGSPVYALGGDEYSLSGTLKIGVVERVDGSQAFVKFEVIDKGVLQLVNAASGPAIIDPMTGEPIILGGTPTAAFNLPGDQPAGIVKPVISPGNSLPPFYTGNGWSFNAGTLNVDYTTDNNYTGMSATGEITGVQSRTGVSAMRKVTGLTNTAFEITRALSPAIQFNGLFGLWIYIGFTQDAGNQPIPGTLLNISIGISTASGASGASIDYSLNLNAIKVGGWNFLAIARSANPTSNTDKEPHPFGINESIGNFNNAKWVTDPATRVVLTVYNPKGYDFYFDRAIYDWDAMPQFVIGSDAAGTDTVNHLIPLMKNYGFGSRGYLAVPNYVRGYSEADYLLPPVPTIKAGMEAAKAANWDFINHTVNHNALGTYTEPGRIRFEIEGNRAWHLSQGYSKGQEFYASPQSSYSSLSQKVIAGMGIKLQRHGSREITHVTSYGVDNLQIIGATDIGGNTWQHTASDPVRWPYNYPHIQNLRTWVDMVIKYKGTAFPFNHAITTLGDPGDGTGNSGDSVTMYRSTFDLFLAYIKLRESEGKCKVCNGVTGFFYGE